MPEWDSIKTGQVDDPVLGLIRYSITETINAICPNCGNSDCEEIEEFKDRLREKIKGEVSE